MSQLSSADAHRQFSQQLSRFTGKARQIVHDHQGVLVYSGGDDVLAFVPVDKCLSCARELHEKFKDLMKDWATENGEKLTLSVGLAIAHFMENLEDLREYGRSAEKHAKNLRVEDRAQEARNALAVHLLKRGGGPIEVRANWTTQPDEHLRTLSQWINKRAISGRVAYDLRKISDMYETWPGETVKDAIKRDTLSVIKGKQPSGESKMKEVEQFIRDRVVDAASLRRLADELLIARQLAAALGQASGETTKQEVSA